MPWTLDQEVEFTFRGANTALLAYSFSFRFPGSFISSCFNSDGKNPQPEFCQELPLYEGQRSIDMLFSYIPDIKFVINKKGLGILLSVLGTGKFLSIQEKSRN